MVWPFRRPLRIRERVIKKFIALSLFYYNDIEGIYMSLLSDLLVRVRFNLCRKNYSENKINFILTKIKEKYKDDEIFNPIVEEEPEEKEVKREELLEQWEEHYKDLGEKTGQFVFKNNKKDINNRYEYGRTLLHKAVLSRDKKEIKELISKKIDYNIRDNSGLTPLQIAVIEEDKEIIDLLKNLGVKND